MVAQLGMTEGSRGLRSLIRHLKSDRPLVPTPLGASLAPRVRQALVAIDEVFRDDAAFDPATLRRAFTLATTDYGDLLLMEPVTARLAADGNDVPAA